MPEKEIGKLLEKEKEKENLINELNHLSNNFEKNKSRMIEIAKILLSEHYGYERKEKSDEK